MEDNDLAIWRMFMNTTLRAAVHLGEDYDTNLRYAKNHLWKSLEQLFNETKRLISDQSEILGPKSPEIIGLKTVEGAKRRRKKCGKIEIYSDELVFTFRQVPQPRKFRLHLKAWGYS